MTSVASAPAPEGLRERKKRLTRMAIFEAAERLFGERGFDDVTVAEIADAANISVKTLFTYVRGKDELIFGGGPTVLDAVAAAVRNRRLGETPLVAAAKGLMTAADDGRLEAFGLMACSGPEASSRLRALWEDTEDALALALARPRDGAPERAARRLEAAQIMVLVRAATSEEVRQLVAVAGQDPVEQRARRAALREWIREAAGSLARGLQASRR
ncbi:MAG TPA: helix-turn-helix domain-containing protein [Trebonia sp.]|nr:helix-turn-helix domain-containing protein [Trebonia sp.]